jgi:hypothetical protein
MKAALLVFVLVVVLVRGILPASDWRWLPGLVVAGVLAAAGLAFALRQRRAAADASWREDPATGVLVAAFALLFALQVSHERRLASDGIDHFVYLRSVWIDGDLDFSNDYARLSPRGASVDPPTPLGRTGNLHPIGPALLWSPFYVAADLFVRLGGGSADGEGPAYRNAVALASLCFGWLGLVLVYRTARARSERWAALTATLAIGFGTFLYWYLAFAPTMAHALAFFAAALFVGVWLGPSVGVRRAAFLGAACGLVALTRWANALIALLPLIEALPRLRRPQEWRPLLRETLAFAAAALVVFSPQMLVWKRLYGSWLTIPQGSAFVGAEPAWSGVLFSPHHGLFSWSPLLYLALPGLWLVFRGMRWRGLAVLVFAVALVRLNAGVADWWGGAAFGARRFDALLPLMGIGLAATLAALTAFAARHPRSLATLLVGTGVGWNLLLARQYQSGAWDYSGPIAFEQMGHAAVSQVDRALGSPFSLPASLWEWLRSGRAPSEYESQFTQRPYARWTMRMGFDERLFLEDGWSAAQNEDGVPARRLLEDSAGFVVPLHGARNYAIGLRARALAAEMPLRVRVLVNQRVSGSIEVSAEWTDGELEVPTEAWRPGRNDIRLRPLGSGTLIVAGAWVEAR